MQNHRPITIGISTCPNDTFSFHALLHGLVDQSAFSFSALFEDVETLNQSTMQGALDVAKVSFHAAGYLRNQYVLLSSGSAMGRGCGPMLIAKQGISYEEIKNGVIAIPGRYTTANLLLQLMTSGHKEVREVRFDHIIDTVASGAVSAGVIIHESRFTYMHYKMALVMDLGKWWEDKTKKLIPLGGIVAKRSLGDPAIRLLEKLISKSIIYAKGHPAASQDFVRLHAQEMSDHVIKQHISLYVNEFSEDIGMEGREAVNALMEYAERLGLIPICNKSLWLAV